MHTRDQIHTTPHRSQYPHTIDPSYTPYTHAPHMHRTHPTHTHTPYTRHSHLTHTADVQHTHARQQTCHKDTHLTCLYVYHTHNYTSPHRHYNHTCCTISQTTHTHLILTTHRSDTSHTPHSHVFTLKSICFWLIRFHTVSEKPHKHVCEGSTPPRPPSRLPPAAPWAPPGGRPGVTPSGPRGTQPDHTQLLRRLPRP